MRNKRADGFDDDIDALIQVDFGEAANVDVVYSTLSSIVDLALSDRSATVEQLNAADRSLTTLLYSLQDAGIDVVFATLPSTRHSIELTTSQPSEPALADITAMVASGFGSLSVDGIAVSLALPASEGM